MVGWVSFDPDRQIADARLATDMYRHRGHVNTERRQFDSGMRFRASIYHRHRHIGAARPDEHEDCRLRTVFAPLGFPAVEPADATDITGLVGVGPQPGRLVQFAWPSRHNVIGQPAEEQVWPVGAVAAITGTPSGSLRTAANGEDRGRSLTSAR